MLSVLLCPELYRCSMQWDICALVQPGQADVHATLQLLLPSPPAHAHGNIDSQAMYTHCDYCDNAHVK